MPEKKCSRCLFYDRCHHDDVCDDFSPWTDEDMDSFLEEEMLERRQEFYEQWDEYVSDFGAD